MTTNIHALCFDAHDPADLARFWADVLEWEVDDDPQDDHPGGATIVPTDHTGFRIWFLPTDAPKTGSNLLHFDVTSSSLEDQEGTVARALAAGGRHLDIGQDPDDGHVVLADPEGNAFCVIEATNNFLAGCPKLGALSSDGLQVVGHFWSEALGWPLVWDQDEETAIQAPEGGTKISWGGPPVDEKVGKNRQHLDVAPLPDGDQDAEVERLLALGATRAESGSGDTSRVELLDPAGNEFCVLSPR
jgi:predicted enzyme related to lactoylglutathione lyase